MELQELSEFLENNQQVEWTQNGQGNFYFRHRIFDKSGEEIQVTPVALKQLTPPQLLNQIINGRNVDHITRVTGYFSRTSSWNKGKIAELADRYRSEVKTIH